MIIERLLRGSFFIGLCVIDYWTKNLGVIPPIAVMIGRGGTDVFVVCDVGGWNVQDLNLIGCSSDDLFVTLESTRSGACPLVGDRIENLMSAFGWV